MPVRRNRRGPLHALAAPFGLVKRIAMTVLPLPRSRRVRAWVAAGWIVLGSVAGIVSVPMFVAPARADVAAADAVVVLAGGRGERFEKGLDLAIRGYGDVLALSAGTGSKLDRVDCEHGTGPNDVAVVCFEPIFDTTRGEARAVADLAEAHGWDRVLLVTSSYHLHRSTTMFERCLDIEVIPVAAQPDISLPAHFNAVFHEWVGVAIAETVRRGC